MRRVVDQRGGSWCFRRYLWVVVFASFEVSVDEPNLQIPLKPRRRSWWFLCFFVWMFFSINTKTDFKDVLLFQLKLQKREISRGWWFLPCVPKCLLYSTQVTASLPFNGIISVLTRLSVLPLLLVFASVFSLVAIAFFFLLASFWILFSLPFFLSFAEMTCWCTNHVTVTSPWQKYSKINKSCLKCLTYKCWCWVKQLLILTTYFFWYLPPE